MDTDPIKSHLAQIGRDGAYVELDVADLASADLSQAKFIVLKNARLELSDPKDVEALKKLVNAHASCSHRATAESIAFMIFREIVRRGLDSVNKEQP